MKASLRWSFCTAFALVFGSSAGAAPAPVPTAMPIATPAPSPASGAVFGGVNTIRSSGGIVQVAPMFGPGSAAGPSLSVQGAGFVTRPADRAVLSVSVSSQSQSGDDAISTSAETLGALQRVLERFHGVVVNETNASINAYANQGSSAPVFNSNAQVEVTVDDLTSMPNVRSAIASAGGTTIGNVRYDVRDRAGAVSEALKAALADAQKQVEALVAKSSLRLGRQRSVQAYVGQNQNVDAKIVRIEATANATYEVSAP